MGQKNNKTLEQHFGLQSGEDGPFLFDYDSRDDSEDSKKNTETSSEDQDVVCYCMR